MEKLVEPEAEDGARVVVHLAISQAGDEEIEFAQAAQDAVVKFGDERAVAVGKLRSGELFVQQFVRVRALALPLGEQAVCGGTGVGSHENFSRS